MCQINNSRASFEQDARNNILWQYGGIAVNNEQQSTPTNQTTAGLYITLIDTEIHRFTFKVLILIAPAAKQKEG
jgi:hypothetical protein